MMNSKILSKLAINLIGVIILTGSLNCCKNQEWRSLFNGKNLDGWTVKCLPADQEKEYWQVKDGTIECNSMGDSEHNYVWLTSDDEFGDFHLKLKFQVYKSSTGNSGVQFRSRYDDSDSAINGGWLHGPQADIHGPNPLRAGLIYDETEEARRWIYPSLRDWDISADQVPYAAYETRFVYFEDDPEAWNSMEIICLGMKIQTIVNGNLVTDFDAEGVLDDEAHKKRRVGTNGCIALQFHQNDDLRIRYKEILIKEL